MTKHIGKEMIIVGFNIQSIENQQVKILKLIIAQP